MKAIWKFPLSISDEIVLPIPRGARVLCVQVQREEPQLWAVCDIEAESELRTFFVYGTGHQHKTIDGTYIGTFQMHEGLLVYHVFERVQ